MTHPPHDQPTAVKLVAAKNTSAPLATRESRFAGMLLPHIAQYHAGSETTYRHAMSDMAKLCGAICADIEREHTVRGRVTKEGLALSAAVWRAADAISVLRGLVNVNAKRRA